MKAGDLIMRLCLASASDIQINVQSSSVVLSGNGDSVNINQSEYEGIVGGISKEMTALQSQQATQARECTEHYLTVLLDALLKNTGDSEQTSNDRFLFYSDPAKYWSGRGIWQNGNYCSQIKDIIRNASDSQQYALASGGSISTKQFTTKAQTLDGNFFVRSFAGGTAHYCAVGNSTPSQNYLYFSCARVVANDPTIFSSVYGATLEDLHDCLGPQNNTDVGECLPASSSRCGSVAQIL